MSNNIDYVKSYYACLRIQQEMGEEIDVLREVLRRYEYQLNRIRGEIVPSNSHAAYMVKGIDDAFKFKDELFKNLDFKKIKPGI